MKKGLLHGIFPLHNQQLSWLHFTHSQSSLETSVVECQMSCNTWDSVTRAQGAICTLQTYGAAPWHSMQAQGDVPQAHQVHCTTCRIISTGSRCRSDGDCAHVDLLHEVTDDSQTLHPQHQTTLCVPDDALCTCAFMFLTSRLCRDINLTTLGTDITLTTSGITFRNSQHKQLLRRKIHLVRVSTVFRRGDTSPSMKES